MMGVNSVPMQARIPAAVDKRKQKKISDYYYFSHKSYVDKSYN